MILEELFQALLMEKQNQQHKILERGGGRRGGGVVEAVGWFANAWQRPGPHWSGHTPLAEALAGALAVELCDRMAASQVMTGLDMHCSVSMTTFPTVSCQCKSIHLCSDIKRMWFSCAD